MKRMLLTGLLAALPVLPALAEEGADPSRLQVDPIVVTATRTERPLDEIPASVDVVTGEKLEDARLVGISEALFGLAGVQSETKNGGYDARLIIRGAGLKARYGVREIMVLLDGVPITDPDGMTRLDFVDTQQVRRIDVVKGPDSTLYGANAAGGVVNIITRSPFEEVSGVRAGYGSDDTEIYSAILSKAFGDTAVSLTGTHKSTDGWRQWNAFESNQAGLKLGHNFSDGSLLTGTFQYTRANLQLPGTLSEEQYFNDPSQLTDEPFRHNSRNSEIGFASLRWEKNFGALDFKPLLYAQSWNHLHPVPGVINDGGANIFGADLQSDWRHRLLGQKGTLTFGLAGQRDDAEGDKYAYRDIVTVFSPFPPPGSERIVASLSDAKGALIEHDEDTVDKVGIYAQEALEFGERWRLDTGLRYDRIDFDLAADILQEYDWGVGNYVTPAQPRVRVERRYEALSPRLGLVYRVLPGLHLYGTIGTGFQTPQSSELADNPGLDPARTVNYEVGLKGRHPAGHSLELALFYMEVSDEIVQSLLEGGETSYSNAGTTIKKGLELTAAAVPLPGLTLSAAYAYSDFYYDEYQEPIRGVSYDRSGNQLPYIPRQQYTLTALYDHRSGLRCRLESSSWGDYYVDAANSAKWKGYDFVTSALVGYRRDGWDLSFDVQNLFDKRYAMEVTKDSGGALRFRPGAPRSYFARVGYTF